MELISTIKDTWKYFILASLLSCLMFFLFLDENHRNSRVTILLQNPPPLEVTASSMIVVAPDPPSPPLEATTSSMIVVDPNPPSPPYEATASSMIVMAPNPPSPPIEATASSMIVVGSDPPSPPPMSSMVTMPMETASHYIEASNIVKPNGTIISEIEKKPSVMSDEVDKSLKKGRTKKQEKKCNMFEGKWVYNPEAKPSYCPLKCPFVEEKMNCQSNGRPDFEYEKWVWQANDCDIPLINGTDLVERFRNKRVIFVGDSLNRNMWESLACLLYSSIPIPSSRAKVMNEFLHIKTFLQAKEDYNFTVEFFWSPYLVHQNKNHSSGKKVLVLDKLSPNSEWWPGADIMVFNSGHWWTQVGKKQGWDLFEYKGKLIEDMPLHQAYARAMKTWANWVEKTVDPKKTTVFYRSISAEHKSTLGKQWCHTKTQPLMDESYKPTYPKVLRRVIENVIKGMRKVQVKYLNITKLSEYRIDAHPSVYRVKEWRTYNQINKHNLSAWADCGHWCLPGVPDTWNRLFYASLLQDTSNDMSIS